MENKHKSAVAALISEHSPVTHEKLKELFVADCPLDEEDNTSDYSMLLLTKVVLNSM